MVMLSSLMLDEYYKDKATKVAKEHIMEFKLMNYKFEKIQAFLKKSKQVT